MIISDLEVLEVVETANVQGGIRDRFYSEVDFVTIDFNSFNNFATFINDPRARGNAASAGAKADAQNNTFLPTYSFTKADTLALTSFLNGSVSASTSVAVINLI